MTKTEQMAQVAIRLKGLRDALDLTTKELAETINVSEDTYISYENGETDIPLSFLNEVARKFNIELHALLFNEDPKMSSYFVTRAGKGAKAERTAAYSYQSLAAGFKNRIFDPLVVTVEPNDAPITLNSHEGQEWDCVIEGRLQIQIGEKVLTLEQGDSIMYDSKRPHGMKALDGKPVKFIAIIS
ncbi:MAG: helix-turn-helix transcriptional regulator [Muribaculaceae bacterium]|nr:helix-turn-helix transcriptional regulator [Muribaculaceae bacterium]